MNDERWMMDTVSIRHQWNRHLLPFVGVSIGLQNKPHVASSRVKANHNCVAIPVFPRHRRVGIRCLLNISVPGIIGLPGNLGPLSSTVSSFRFSCGWHLIRTAEGLLTFRSVADVTFCTSTNFMTNYARIHLLNLLQCHDSGSWKDSFTWFA